MSSPATPAMTAEPLPLHLAAILRGAARRLTWKIAGATLAIAVALHAWFMAEAGLTTFPDLPSMRMHLSRAITDVLMAYCTLFATLVADEAAQRGAKRLRAYGWAIVAGSAVAALVQLQVHHWLQWRVDWRGSSIAQIGQPVSVFLEYLLWAAIIVVVYVNRQTALQASARMNAAHVERARVQRRTLESRLQALQARIEPQFLFNTLMQVRQLYERDPASGARMLDDLIVYLRAALPQMRDSSSTVAQELQLASAYLSIKRPQCMGDGLRVALGPAALAARMPAMMLLPLLDRLLAAQSTTSLAPAPIEISVSAPEGALRVEMRDRNVPAVEQDTHDVLQDVRARLRVLYGDKGRLCLESEDGARILLEIPHDPADSDRR